MAQKHLPAEQRQRIEDIIKSRQQTTSSPELLRALRWVAILERLGTAEAKDKLKELAAGAPGARLTQEAQAALGRLGK